MACWVWKRKSPANVKKATWPRPLYLFSAFLIRYARVGSPRQFTCKVTLICAVVIRLKLPLFICLSARVRFTCLLLLFDYGVHGSIKFFLVFFSLFNLFSCVIHNAFTYECIDFCFLCLAHIKFGLPCTAILFVIQMSLLKSQSFQFFT